MIFHSFERDDGDYVMEMDAEAIDYLTRGLQQLRGSDAGTELATESLVSDGDTGEPEGVGWLVLLRAEDER